MAEMIYLNDGSRVPIFDESTFDDLILEKLGRSAYCYYMNRQETWRQELEDCQTKLQEAIAALDSFDQYDD